MDGSITEYVCYDGIYEKIKEDKDTKDDDDVGERVCVIAGWLSIVIIISIVVLICVRYSNKKDLASKVNSISFVDTKAKEREEYDLLFKYD